jgi:hypothetical protein
MIINHKVPMLCDSQDGEAAGKPHSSIMAAVEVDGVIVLFENPDERCLIVATIGGTLKDNKRVMSLWYKHCEEVDPDEDRNQVPDKARDTFVKWLVQRS